MMEPKFERRVSDPEERKKFGEFKSLIESGLIGVTEVIEARDKGLITAKQCDTLALLREGGLIKTAETDSVTGILNRTSFPSRIEGLKQDLDANGGEERRKDPVKSIMVISLDINDFKKFNDRFGHQVGDRVLKATGERLRKAITKKDLIFRFGGDEFVAVLPINEDNELSLLAIFDRIERNLNNNFTVEGADIPVKLSLGYEVIKRGDDISAVLAKSDKNMYTAKGRMKGVH